jgi:hypothetical protein
MDKDYYQNEKTARDESDEKQKSDTGKDIKKGMDRYEERIKSVAEGEAPPTGDSTRSEE